MPDLAAGATKEQMLRAIKGHVLAETRLMDTYDKARMHKEPAQSAEDSPYVQSSSCLDGEWLDGWAVLS